MPGFAVQQGATVVCTHFGQAEPSVSNTRVTLGGSATISLAPLWRVDSCSPPSGPPCATAQWITGSTRVTSMGQPLVIQGGAAICLPTGATLTVTTSQNRVRCA